MWRVTLVFRVCGESMNRLLEHGFYDLALHMWRREPNQEPARDALSIVCYIYIYIYISRGIYLEKLVLSKNVHESSKGLLALSVVYKYID
jgi:hypothetical protein